LALCHCSYRSADGSSEIDAEVGPDTLQYRVHPRVGKHRRDAGKLKRIAQKLSTRDTRTFPAPLSSYEREERKSLAFVDNLRGQNLSILKDLPIALKLLKDDFERVPGPQIGGEVQVPIHIREIIDNPRWYPSIDRGIMETAINATADGVPDQC